MSTRFVGPAIKTPELHEVTGGPSNCVYINNDGWCYEWVQLTIQAQPGWKFIPGTQQVFCTQDNQGSAAWNGLPFNVGNTQKFQTILFTDTLVTAQALMQSRSIYIALSVAANPATVNAEFDVKQNLGIPENLKPLADKAVLIKNFTLVDCVKFNSADAIYNYYDIICPCCVWVYTTDNGQVVNGVQFSLLPGSRLSVAIANQFWSYC